MQQSEHVQHQPEASGASGPFGRLCNLCAALISLLAIAWAGDLATRLGLVIYTEQFLAVILGLSLAIVYLRDADHPKTPLHRICNITIALCSAASAFYLAVFYADLLVRQMQMPWDGLILSGILLLAILEGVRRTLGPMLVIVIGVILVLGLLGHHIPGPLQTRYVPPERMLMYVGLDSGGMLGVTLLIAATIVIAFILFGQVLLASGAGTFFNDLALGLMGRRRGGSAKIAIVGSGLFGTISGVVVSNIVATGVITIKIMIQGGYRRTTAAAMEAVASTGGQILPPIMGAVAFLMAEILQVPYAQIVVAAIIPAGLFYIAVFLQADLEAAKNRIPPIEAHLIPRTRQVLRQGWPYALPFAVVIAALFFLNQRADSAAFYGAVAALAVGFISRYGDARLTVAKLFNVLVATGMTVIDIVLIAASAGYLIGVLNISGLGFGLSYTLVQIGSANLFVLLMLSGFLCILLGMGMPTVGVYLVLSVMIAPAIVEVGVDPIAAHMFIFYLGMMSMVTPPVGIAAFFAATIARADKMRTAFEAMRIGWTAYVIPFVFVVTPALLMNAPWFVILFDLAAAIAGVWLISMASVGWFQGDASPGLRLLLFGIGAAFLWPDHILFGDWHTLDLVALAAIGALLLARRRRLQTTERIVE